MKRILIVSQYFWPETFQINGIAKNLKNRGYRITVLTGKPNYPNGKFFNGYGFFKNNYEKWNGIDLYRSPLFPRGSGSGIKLFLNYLSFFLFSSIRILTINKKFDLIFVYEPSPITVGIPALIAKKKFKIPIYFWVQDLWPESLTAAGGIKNKFILNVADKITRFIYNSSDKLLVQSKSFIPYIKGQNIKLNKIIYFPNTTESFYKLVSSNNKYKSIMPQGIKIMFAGNIGEAQSFETLLKAAYYLKENKKKNKLDYYW